jgi:hypothetical protein
MPLYILPEYRAHTTTVSSSPPLVSASRLRFLVSPFRPDSVDHLEPSDSHLDHRLASPVSLALQAPWSRPSPLHFLLRLRVAERYTLRLIAGAHRTERHTLELLRIGLTESGANHYTMLFWTLSACEDPTLQLISPPLF